MRKKNTVRDEAGRQRFHGAFTGGFSAGYYNTVGSEEGFQPKTFVSSRKQRAEKNVQSIRDFMDEEDGLLGGSLAAKKEVDSFLPQEEQRQKAKSVLFEDEATSENSRAVQLLLANLVIEPTNTMGKKILGMFGWKPGMAIGPRVKKVEYSNLALSRDSLPQQSLEDGMITVAPREDKSAFEAYPTPKTNYQGIGYVPNEFDSARDEWEGRGDNARYDEEENRYRVSDLFKKKDPSKRPTEESAPRKSQKRKGAVYLDDDDDIAFHDDDEDRFHYSKVAVAEGDMDDEEEYHPKKLQKKEQEIDRYILQSSTESIPNHLTQLRSPSDNKLPIPGFHVAQNAQMIPSFFPPPEIPKDFKPVHVFRINESSETSQPEKESSFLINTLKTQKVNILENAEKRKTLLNDDNGGIKKSEQDIGQKKEGTAPKVPSVFDYLKPADRARILGLAQKLNPTFNSTNIEQPISAKPLLADLETEKPAAVAAPPVEEEKRPLLVSSSLLTSAFAGLSESFKNRFTTSATSTSSTTPGDPVNPIGIVKEGLASLQEYSQLVQEKQKQTAAANPSTKVDETLKSGAASQRIHRTTVLWTPNPLLCKRCHIRMPEIASISQSSFDEKSHQKSSTADSMFQRLFTDVPSSSASSGALKKSREEEEKERKEKEKREQQLQEEFATFDVYQTTEPKPALSIFKSIFADSESESESESEDEADEEEKEDKTEKIEDKPFPAKNEQKEASIPRIAAEQFAKPSSIDNSDKNPPNTEELKMPKFIPRSKRSSGLENSNGGKSNRGIVHASSSSSRFKLSVGSLVATENETGEAEDEDDGLVLLAPSQKDQRRTSRAEILEVENSPIITTSLKRKPEDNLPTSNPVEPLSRDGESDDFPVSSIQFKRRRVMNPANLPLRVTEKESDITKPERMLRQIIAEQAEQTDISLNKAEETASVIARGSSPSQSHDIFVKNVDNEIPPSQSLLQSVPLSTVTKGIELLQQSLLNDVNLQKSEKRKEKKSRDKKEKKKKEKKSKKSSQKHHKKEKKNKKEKKSKSEVEQRRDEEKKEVADSSSDESSEESSESEGL